MKILLTGHAGFIGSNVFKLLHSQGHTIVGFDNYSNPAIGFWPTVSYAVGKIQDELDLYKVMVHEPFDAIIHLAAVGSVPRSFARPGLTMESNVLGFTNVMRMAKEFKIKSVVFASSSSVYGTSTSVIKTEGEEGLPLSPYALSKSMNEQFANMWCNRNGINYVGLRFFNVYGPGQQFDSEYSAVIPKFITLDKPTIYGDGSTVRDFTYVEDIAQAVLKALEYSKTRSGIYNVGTGYGTSLSVLLNLLGKNAIHAPARVGEAKISIASTERAKEFLGWEAATNIEEGLEKTKEFYEQVKKTSQI